MSDWGQFLKSQEGRLVVDIEGQAGQQGVRQHVLAGASLQHLEKNTRQSATVKGHMLATTTTIL